MERSGNKNSLTVEEFVNLALYHPKVGYYKRKKNRVGKKIETDFYTSNTLGKLWGEMIIAACTNICGDQNIDQMHFVEIAAEPSCSVMKGLITPFKSINTIRLGDPIKIPDNAIVFSNEWLDAQPFKRLTYDCEQKAWHDIGITLEGDHFKEIKLSANSTNNFPKNKTNHYTIDWPTGAKKILEQVLSIPWQGMFLTFDYGLSREVLINERPMGTARGYRNHQIIKNPFVNPGKQDITCHLCWDELVNSLKYFNFNEVKLQSQESFFMHNSQKRIKQIFQDAKGMPNNQMLQLREMIHPQHFGTKFQALWGIRK